jgi:hypothetical protein
MTRNSPVKEMTAFEATRDQRRRRTIELYVVATIAESEERGAELKTGNPS